MRPAAYDAKRLSMDAVLAALCRWMRFWLPLQAFCAVVVPLDCPTSPDGHEASRGADGAWL